MSVVFSSAGRRHYDKHCGSQTPTNQRVYSYLSGSSGDIETDSKESPYNSRDQQQRKLLNSNRPNSDPYSQPIAQLKVGQNQSGLSSQKSSSDNYSDATVTDSALVLATSGTLALRGNNQSDKRELFFLTSITDSALYLRP